MSSGGEGWGGGLAISDFGAGVQTQSKDMKYVEILRSQLDLTTLIPRSSTRKRGSDDSFIETALSANYSVVHTTFMYF